MKGFSTPHDEELARLISVRVSHGLAERLSTIAARHMRGTLPPDLCAECAMPWPCWTYAMTKAGEGCL